MGSEMCIRDSCFGSIESVKDEQLIKVIEGKQMREGLVVAGPPCQPFSRLNSLRGGFEDDRSDGIGNYVEIVKRLKRLIPRVRWSDMMENVASMTSGDREKITDRLKEIRQQSSQASPYWLDAAVLGPCSRPRLFWTSFDIDEGELISEEESRRRLGDRRRSHWNEPGYTKLINPKEDKISAKPFLDSGVEKVGRKPFPTALRWIDRERPPPDPAGLDCLLYTSPSPRDRTRSRMPSSA